MRGNGRIFQRKESSNFWIAYYLRGREYRESAGTSEEKQAQRFLKHRLKEVGADQLGIKKFTPPQQQRVTVSELLDALQKDYELRGKRSPQFDSHLTHVRDYFGAMRAVDVTAEGVDSYIAQQLAADVRPATVNRSSQLLKQAFGLALRRGHLAHVPVIRRLSEAGNARQGFFSDVEFRTLAANLPDYLQDFARFGYLTGWRRGEIDSLSWADVAGDVIRLRPENSKNGEGRVVVLEGELAELIERRRAARHVRTPNGVTLAGLVFHNDGHPIVDFRKAWATARRLAGVPNRLFHDLRRTAVRNMVRAGVPEKVAMQVSGHKTRSIFDRYNIVSEHDLREAMQRTQEYLKAGARESERVVSMPA